MITKVQKWGNSQGMRLSKSILANAAIEIGDEVEVVRRIPKDSRTEELEWGSPVGREVW